MKIRENTFEKTTTNVWYYVRPGRADIPPGGGEHLAIRFDNISWNYNSIRKC